MSVLQYSDGLELKPGTDLQIWNNAAFDSADFSEDSSLMKPSCWPSAKTPTMSLLTESRDSVNSVSSSKENQSPQFQDDDNIKSNSNSIHSSINSVPLKPIQPNGVKEKPRIKPSKAGSVKGPEEKERDEKKIDEEIEEIEKEISRLSSRLEALRIEKLEKSIKTVEKRGRVVAAKFMESKHGAKNFVEEKRKIEESLSVSAKGKVNRRGLSLGPNEIAAGMRRGMSMGPAEIFGAAKARRQYGKQEVSITPVQPIQSRRKSCFWKLQDIDEEKTMNKEKVDKSLSVSPKSRKVMAKTPGVSRQAVTTIGSKTAIKKDDAIVNSVQPKKLFRDGEKSVPPSNKKPLRSGRVVASRYNQSTGQASAIRKRSLPENDNDENSRLDKKRSLSAGKTRPSTSESSKNLGTEGRVKKRWEIPSEIVLNRNLEDEDKASPKVDLLPRIRIGRRINDRPRDSGPAKRVVELIGKKSFFWNEEDVEPSVCQALSFLEADEEES